MRHRLARVLHMLGIHLACRERREPWLLPALRLEDGTTWTPDISGIPPSSLIHF